MAVYLLEIPNEEQGSLTPDEVKGILNDAFEGVATVGVSLKHSGSLKDLEWRELYDATMGAG